MAQATLHQGMPVARYGADVAAASAATIMIHGRGATAEDILYLASSRRSQ